MSVKIVKKLSEWFRVNQRKLPWRESPDPYRVWLSEVMLQQTQVATALPYFQRFIQEFPRVQDLAQATEEQVFQLWAGLGYYSRARNLHRGAKAITSRIESGLGFPQNREEWLQVPGVGEYTAGAICSISGNQPEPIVDGNVVRVLSRVAAIENLDSKKSEIWKLSRALVQTPGVVPRDFNQGLMELGALVCKPKNPACSSCPIRAECAGKKDPLQYPKKSSSVKWVQVQEKRWVILKKTQNTYQVFLAKNHGTRWRAGLWDFPEPDDSRMSAAVLLGEFDLKYTVTRHRVDRHHTILVCGARSPISLRSEGQWFDLHALPGVPAPVKKALQKIPTPQTPVKGNRKSRSNESDRSQVSFPEADK